MTTDNNNDITCNIYELNEILRLSYNDVKYNTPLHIAASHGNITVLIYLLHQSQYNSLLDTVNNYNETPIYLAAHYEHLDIVSYLLQCGASINYKFKQSFIYHYTHKQQQHSNKHINKYNNKQSNNTQHTITTRKQYRDPGVADLINSFHKLSYHNQQHHQYRHKHSNTQQPQLNDGYDYLDKLSYIPSLIQRNYIERNDYIKQSLDEHFTPEIANIVIQYETNMCCISI